MAKCADCGKESGSEQHWQLQCEESVCGVTLASLKNDLLMSEAMNAHQKGTIAELQADILDVCKKALPIIREAAIYDARDEALGAILAAITKYEGR